MPLETLKIMAKTIQEIELKRQDTGAILKKIDGLSDKINKNMYATQKLEIKLRDSQRSTKNKALIRKVIIAIDLFILIWILIIL